MKSTVQPEQHHHSSGRIYQSEICQSNGMLAIVRRRLLTDARANLNVLVTGMHLYNLGLSSRLQVEALSNIILANCETFWQLNFKSSECAPPASSSNKQDRDRSIGFLDPLVYASSRDPSFNHLQRSLSMSANARFRCVPARLNDSRCLAITERVFNNS